MPNWTPDFKTEYSIDLGLQMQIIENFSAPAGYYIYEANQNCYLLLLSVEGEGTLEYEGETFTLEKGKGFFIDCHKLHYFGISSEKWVTTQIWFTGGSAASFFNFFIEGYGIYFSYEKSLKFNKLYNNLKRSYEKVNVITKYTTSHNLTALITHIKKHTKVDIYLPYYCLQLKTFFDKNYTNRLVRGIPADFLEIDRSTLEHDFAKSFGCTPYEYLCTIRVEEAMILLKKTDLPDKEIAIRAGFASNRSFIKTFTKITGKSPSAFR